MSWDVLVYKFPKDIETLDQLPNGFKLPSMGSRAEIADSVLKVFPNASISNLSWLVIDGEGFSIEVNVGKSEPCEGFMLHIRGGDTALDAITRLAALFDARAYDMTSSEFIDRMIDPTNGFRKWRAYRDKFSGGRTKPG